MQNRNYELALLTARYWEYPGINQEICLEFDLKKPIKEQLKRVILKHIFDPLGLISPVPITGKDMYKEACDPKFSWDEQLAESLKTKWIKWSDSLPQKAEVSRSIPTFEDETPFVDLYVFDCMLLLIKRMKQVTNH